MFETTRRPKPLVRTLNQTPGLEQPDASRIAPRPTAARAASGMAEQTPAAPLPSAPALERSLVGVINPMATIAKLPAPEASNPGMQRSAQRPSPAQPRTLPDKWTPTLNSGTGERGEPIYDQASVEKLASRPGIQRSLPTAVGSPMAAKPAAVDVSRTLPQTIARPSPNVASTFGQSVRQLPDDGIPDRRSSRPTATGGMTLPNGGSFREPGSMGEKYNSREDREARTKQLSDLDSQRFRLEMIAGNPGRRGRAAIDALSANAGQQNELVNEGARLTADAIAKRAGNATTLANTGLEQSGQDRRAQLGIEANAATSAADRDQQFDIATMNDATERAKQGKPETLTGADGTVYRITGDGTASPVKDGQGNNVRAPVARDSSALSVADQLDSVGGELKAATEQLTAMAGINGSATPEQIKAQQDYVTRLKGDLGTLRGGGGAGSSAKPGNRQKPSLEQFMARAKSQGSKMTPQQLQAYYDQMQ